MSEPEHQVVEWTGDRFRPAPDDDGRLLVADSWLVDEGRMLAIDLHRERFTAAVEQALAAAAAHSPARPDGSQLDGGAFFEAAIERLSGEGKWFPRIELISGAATAETFSEPDAGGVGVLDDLRLRLRIRRAPELRRSVVLGTWSGDDPRLTPTVKGPDIERLAAASAEVRARGADEAVFTDASTGAVVDGATSAIMWWRGDTMVFPDARFARVPSVTARLMRTLAAVRGIEVAEESATPSELDGLEVWTLNALHGPRIVTAWRDGPDVAELPGRLAAWRAALDGLRRHPPRNG